MTVATLTCSRCGRELFQSKADGFLLDTADTSYKCPGFSWEDDDGYHVTDDVTTQEGTALRPRDTSTLPH